MSVADADVGLEELIWPRTGWYWVNAGRVGWLKVDVWKCGVAKQSVHCFVLTRK